MDTRDYINSKKIQPVDQLNNNTDQSQSSKPIIQNYFRGDHIQMKNDKDKIYFSPRTKETETIKAKPRLLTDRLPTAFVVYGQKTETEGMSLQSAKQKDEKYNWVNNNTEGNVFPRDERIKKEKQLEEEMPSWRISNYTKLTKPLNSKISLDYKTKNNSADKDWNIQPPLWNRARTKTEGSEPEDKAIISKPIYLRGSSAYTGSSEKGKHWINSNIKLTNFNTCNNSKQTSNEGRDANACNRASLSVKKVIENTNINLNNNNNNNNNNQYSSSAMNNPWPMNRTLKNFLPKIKMEEIEPRQPLNYRKEILSLDNKPEKINLEDGITYQTNTNYKLFFHIPSMKVYILKEIKFTNSSGWVDKWSQLKKKSWFNINNSTSKITDDTDHCYLTIINYYVNNPEGYISILIEKPQGETLADVITSIGFIDSNLLSVIITQLINVPVKTQNSCCVNSSNTMFCACDVYLDHKGNVKLFPDIIRDNISTSICQCKTTWYNLTNKYNNTKEFWYLSLGYLIIKCITGNIPLKCFEWFLVENIQNKFHKECCWLHSLLKIEETFLNSSEYLLLSNILQLYQGSLIQLICVLTSYTKTKNEIEMKLKSNTWLHTPNRTPTKVDLSIEELFTMVKYGNDKHISFDGFCNSFDIVFNNWRMNPSGSNGDNAVYNINYFNKLKTETFSLITWGKCFDYEKDEIVRLLKNKVFQYSERKDEGEGKWNIYCWNGINKVLSN